MLKAGKEGTSREHQQKCSQDFTGERIVRKKRKLGIREIHLSLSMLSLLLVVALLYLLALASWSVALVRDAPPDKLAGENLLPISVVIAARNEAANLPALFAALARQVDAPDHEVILVLDRCTDGSLALAQAQAAVNPRLRLLEIAATPPGWSPKKWALQSGIAQARYGHLAFTDADCQPESGWLSGIAAQFATGKELVLGIGLYQRQAGPLNAFIQHETQLTAVQYLGLAACGLPYMGVGRNLAYTKAFFEAAGGFSDIAHRLSGDDDLLVNHHARGPLTGLMAQPGTRTYSIPKKTFRGWWSQKMRHLSAGTAYKLGSQLILSAFHGLHAIFYLSLAVALMMGHPWVPIVLIYTGRAVLAAIFWNLHQGLRHRWELWLVFPVLDVAYLLYHLVMVPASLVIKPKWQGK